MNSATAISMSALVYAPSTSTFQVPKAKRSSWRSRRAKAYAATDSPRAITCELMCHPSASSAIELNFQPASSSTSMVTAVSSTTQRVRRSASGLTSSNWWVCATLVPGVSLVMRGSSRSLRIFAAMVLSLAFTLSYATWAAKSARAAKLLIPLLDILQSVPILGFISITVVFFMSLVPGRVLGAEFAAIFAIFTSQAWNMAFSFYQSLRTVPTELEEAAASFHLTPWMRFWQLEVPFGLPALVWNMMMSMSGGWFFVVSSESISVGHTSVALPGIGSYIALAIQQRNLHAIGWAIATMGLVILVYDQLLFPPLIGWVERFRVEQEPGMEPPAAWALAMMRRLRLITGLTVLFYSAVRWTSWASAPHEALRPDGAPAPHARWRGWELIWPALLLAIVALALRKLAQTLFAQTQLAELRTVGLLGLLTMVRVVVLIGLASLLWVPVGVWIGMRPRVAQWVQPLAQFLAAFPANLLFPLAVYAIVAWQLNPDLWLSPLMILGTQG